MRKQQGPKELALDLLPRSPCKEQVAAVLVDGKGKIFAWGWNHPIRGNGKDVGRHAEDHCVGRANRKRLNGATMFVAGRRASNGAILNARPCDGSKKYWTAQKRSCMDLLRDKGVKKVIHTLYSPDSLHVSWEQFDL